MRHSNRHEITGRYHPLPAEATALIDTEAAPEPGSEADIDCVGDVGHKDTVSGDIVVLHNAHPHITSPRLPESIEHIVHDKRDKGAEHHPTKGLMSY